MRLAKLSLAILVAFFIQAVSPSVVGNDQGLSGQASSIEVVFETTLGTFSVELYPEKAPKTVANFLTYVDQGFYANTLFHRVIPGFAVQGGGLDKDMQEKPALSPVENESENGLKNVPGTVAMARKRDPNSATSQFFINLRHNQRLDARVGFPGYTVFGRIISGMDVILKMADIPTKMVGRRTDVPQEDIVILSAKRRESDIQAGERETFTEGVHYVVLDEPVPTRDSKKIEVVEAFAYGCPYCLSIESQVQDWEKRQESDVDFWYFPAVWSESMRLYAQVFYTARQLGVAKQMHLPLFNAIVVEQRTLRSPRELAKFFEPYGIDQASFIKAFHSPTVERQVKEAEGRVGSYELSGVPQFIVNGKYKIDPVRAGGRKEMLDVVDFLVKKERTSLDKVSP